MVTVRWSATRLIHHSFLNPGKTITAEKYCHEINEMDQKLQCMYPALVNRKGPIFLHDDTRLHVTQPALQKLNELGYEILPHPPYSPNLLTTDYHFFKHFDSLQEKVVNDQTAANNAFKEFIASRTSEFYSTGINKFVSCWQKCVDSNVFYFD